jgi:myo-inositol-1(or 4)-monophosphatase
MDLRDVLGIATEAARAAVAVHREHLGRVHVEEWSEKGYHDFVSRVDRDAEARIIERIHASYPDHRFLSEEEATAPVGIVAESGSGAAGEPGGGHISIPAERLAEAKKEPGWLWIIDPLDGTTNYLHRYPMYAASVAGVRDGELAVAVVIDGSTGAEWTAIRGGGAYLDGTRVRVSDTTEPSRALIGTGYPFKALDALDEYLRQFARIVKATAGVRRAGAAALDLCHLASGYFDGFWELTLAPWDVAAGALIVREAGGTITRMDGNADIIGSGSVLASNGRLHAWLASELRERM